MVCEALLLQSLSSTPLMDQSTEAAAVGSIRPPQYTSKVIASPSFAMPLTVPLTTFTPTKRSMVALGFTVACAVFMVVSTATAPPPLTTEAVFKVTRRVSSPSPKPSWAGVRVKSALELPAGMRTRPLAPWWFEKLLSTPSALLNSDAPRPFVPSGPFACMSITALHASVTGAAFAMSRVTRKVTAVPSSTLPVPTRERVAVASSFAAIGAVARRTPRRGAMLPPPPLGVCSSTRSVSCASPRSSSSARMVMSPWVLPAVITSSPRSPLMAGVTPPELSIS